MPVNDYKKPQTEAKAMLHRLLEQLRLQLGRDPQERVEPEEFFPVNLNLLVELLGWTVQQVSMVGHRPTAEPLMAKCIRAEKKLMLLSSLSDGTKRFSLAHELGHVVLHYELAECNLSDLPRLHSMVSKKYPDTQYSELERQAEVFARDLLMPEKAVRLQFRKLFGVDQLRAGSEQFRRYAPPTHQDRPTDVGTAAEQLAEWQGEFSSLMNFFGVSRRAMSKRLIELYRVY